jgi:hypothetical protein
MSPNKKLFPDSKQRRERGTGLDVGYSMIWRGCEWDPLIAPAPNLQKALASGPTMSLDEDMHPVTALFQIAIAPKDATLKRTEGNLEYTENLRDSVKEFLSVRGKYKGFLDHALKEKHCLWIRFKSMSSYDNAKRDGEKILDKYDYAWVQQRSGPARTLALRPRIFCGCCCRTGFDIVEGPPKFSKEESSFKKLMSRKK